MIKKLTDRAVKALRPAEKPYEVRDDVLTGFLVRVQPAGSRVFYVEYRAETGRRNRYRLGAYPEMGVPAAREAARAKLAQIALGADPASERAAARNALTLKEFLDKHYSPWAERNLKSHHSVMNRLRSGFAGLLDRKLSEITSFDLERNRMARLKDKSRGKTPKPATVNRDQATLQAALTKAQQWGMIAVNPVRGIKRSREDKNTSIRALSHTEEQRILATFEAQRQEATKQRFEQARKGWKTGPVPDFLSYFHPLFILALDSGLRRAEIQQLRWTDADFAGRLLYVRGVHTKSSQTRRIPMTARVHDTLARWANQNGKEGLVFPAASGESIRWYWLATCREAGVTGVRFHDLRHTCASRLASNGVNILSIKSILGHSSVVTTQRYMHAAESDLRRAMNTLDDAKQKEGSDNAAMG